MVIWANHSLRASIAAMRALSMRAAEQSVAHARAIVSVDDTIRLVGNAELDQDERRYAEFGERIGGHQ